MSTEKYNQTLQIGRLLSLEHLAVNCTSLSENFEASEKLDQARMLIREAINLLVKEQR